MRGGGFGPPPPHEGQISTLPPSNLRLQVSQSCQALSWATPESGPNFSAFKACSRRQVVTGSASAGHTAKQNPRARRQLPENRGHWQPPQTVPGLRLGTQSHLGRESLTNLARSSRSGRRRAKARGSNKHSIFQSEVCCADPAREFNSPATAININLLLDSDSVSLAISARATISAPVTRPVNLIRRRRQSNHFG